MGFLYNDFRFLRAGVPPKPRPPLPTCLSRVFPLPPPPALGSPNPPDRPFELCSQSWGRHYVDIITHGYGFIWQLVEKFGLVPGVKLTTSQRDAIRQFTVSRVAMFESAYAYQELGLPFVQREIYPLIERTEKTLLSFLLGSVMCQTAGRECVRQRLGIDLGRMFHASLLKSTKHAHNPVIILPKSASCPDFIAIDASNRFHLFEAKGMGGKFRAAEAWKGLKQLLNIESVDGLFPATRNVCVSYVQHAKSDTHAALPPRAPDGSTWAKTVHTSVIHSDHRTSVHSEGGDLTARTKQLLTGRYALAVYFYLEALADLDGADKISTGASNDGWMNVDFERLSVVFIVSRRFVGLMRDMETKAPAVLDRRQFFSAAQLNELCIQIGEQIQTIDSEQQSLPSNRPNAIFIEGKWLAMELRQSVESPS